MKRIIVLIVVVILALSGGVLALRHTNTSKPTENTSQTAQNAHTPLTADDIFSLVNQQRVNSGLQPYIAAAELAKSSLDKCLDMVKGNYYAHINPTTGMQGYEYIKQELPSAKDLSENIEKIASDDPQLIVDRWMASPEHKAAILSTDFTVSGLSICRDPNDIYQQNFIVEHFASLQSQTTYVAPQSIGTLCQDGWISSSTGSGSCSWHGGEL